MPTYVDGSEIGQSLANHTVIIAMGRPQDVPASLGNIVFFSALTPLGTIKTPNQYIKKVVLVLSFRFENTFAGENSIKSGTWQIKIGSEAYWAIPFPMSGGSGKFSDGELHCQVEGGGFNEGFKADITNYIKAGSENLGSAVSIMLKDAEANQNNLKLTVSAWYEVLERNI